MRNDIISEQVGQTSSGEIVLFQRHIIEGDHIRPIVQVFANNMDYFDAHAIFEALSLRELLLNNESVFFLAYYFLKDEYLDQVKDVETIKRRIGIKTSVGLANYGRSLCLECFKNLRR